MAAVTLLADVESWCQQQLPAPAPSPLRLLNVRPTDAELTAWPMNLSIQAYFAGARHAAGEPLRAFPRPLTAAEADSWADGVAEHRTQPVPHLELDDLDAAVICA